MRLLTASHVFCATGPGPRKRWRGSIRSSLRAGTTTTIRCRIIRPGRTTLVRPVVRVRRSPASGADVARDRFTGRLTGEKTMAKRMIDAETILNRAKPLTHRDAQDQRRYDDVIVWVNKTLDRDPEHLDRAFEHLERTRRTRPRVDPSRRGTVVGRLAR
jgi:hypothetical protein